MSHNLREKENQFQNEMRSCFTRNHLHAMNAEAAAGEKTEAYDDNSNEGGWFEENHLNWF